MMDNEKVRECQMDDAAKMKISQKLKGRSKTEDQKQKIANGLKKYWSQMPPKQP